LGHYYYQAHLDYERALEQFAIARKDKPNNSEILSFIGFVQRRQGNFEEALVNIKKASELDPRSGLAEEVGETYMLLRNYPEAERYFNRAISVSPDVPLAYSWKAWLYLCWEGSTGKAREVLEEALQNIGSVEDQFIILRSVLLNVFDGDYQEALDRLSSCKLEAFDTQFFFIPKVQLYAQINGLMGNQQLKQANYESARSILETKIKERRSLCPAKPWRSMGQGSNRLTVFNFASYHKILSSVHSLLSKLVKIAASSEQGYI